MIRRIRQNARDKWNRRASVWTVAIKAPRNVAIKAEQLEAIWKPAPNDFAIYTLPAFAGTAMCSARAVDVI